MIRVKKFIVGIRPAHKMFRISSLAGSIIDALLMARRERPLHDAYFSEVGRSTDGRGYVLSNTELGNVFRLEEDNVIFLKDMYSSEKKFDIQNVLAEWRYLWKVMHQILEVRDIRRIGVACEHQFEAKDGAASNSLVSSYLSGVGVKHAGRFNLQFEDRRPVTSKVGLPDINKDAFINVIHQYYDSELDSDYPAAGAINVNLDVQKYYWPYFNGNVFDEVGEVTRLFEKERQQVDADLRKRGVI